MEGVPELIFSVNDASQVREGSDVVDKFQNAKVSSNDGAHGMVVSARREGFDCLLKVKYDDGDEDDDDDLDDDF